MPAPSALFAGRQKFNSARSFFPARAGGAPASEIRPTARATATEERERPLGKAIGEYGTVARRRVSRRVRRRGGGTARATRARGPAPRLDLTAGVPSHS